jgi:hypothetical protein
MLMIGLRWHTALPVRQAMAKMRFGDEAATSPQAKLLIERKEPRYVVGVTGMPPLLIAARGGNFADRVKQITELRRKDKDPLKPADVQGEMDQSTQRANLYIVFPKDDATAITLDDKEVEFFMKLPQAEVKRKFKLKDLVYNGKLEL